MPIEYRGVGGGPYNSGGGSGGSSYFSDGGRGGSETYSQSAMIDGTLESETKEICRVMGGAQPSESDWDMFFMKNQVSGGRGVLGIVYDKMVAAHNVAQHLRRKQIKSPAFPRGQV